MARRSRYSNPVASGDWKMLGVLLMVIGLAVMLYAIHYPHSSIWSGSITWAWVVGIAGGVVALFGLAKHTGFKLAP